MIRFDCPDCGATVKTQDEAGGLNAKCPSCKSRIKVPEAPLQVESPPGTLFRRGIRSGTLASVLAIVGLLYMIRVDWWVRSVPFVIALVGLALSIRALKKNDKLAVVLVALLLNLTLMGLGVLVSVFALALR